MIYVAVQFIHVLGALGMAAAYSVEALALVGLRRAKDGDRARAWLRVRPLVLGLGATSLVLVLGSGIYTAVVGWEFAGWMIVAIGGLVAIAAIGGTLTGIPMARITAKVQRAPGVLPEELRRGLESWALVISITTRIAIMLGIVFLMIRKPETVTSLAVVAVAAALGVLTGAVLATRRPQRRYA